MVRENVLSMSFEKIFRFDKKIRYCGIIDEKGELVAGNMRKGLQSLEPESEDKKLFAQIALAVGMNRGWDRYFGKTMCIVILKEKVSFFIFTLSNLKSIVLVVDSSMSVAKTRKLGELIDTSDWSFAGQLQ